MKLFLSWSGSRSKEIAVTLREWLPNVIPGIHPWMSDRDIDAGARWNEEIQKSLAASRYGIVCLTTACYDSHWVLFEAGALAKTIQRGYVVPYLIDFDESDLAGSPLTQFQSKTADESGTFDLLNSINKRLAEDKRSAKNTLPPAVLKKNFNKHWPALESKLGQRSGRDDLNSEVLETLATIVSATKKAAKIDNPNFRNHILRNLQNIAGKAADWENGTLYVHPEDGVEFLVDLYESAKKNIFSTSVKGFFSDMIDRPGTDALLSIHEHSKTPCTRVFLFDKRKDIEEVDLDIIKRNINAGVDVRIYIEDSSPRWQFPSQLPHDFTIIDDGDAIGWSECLDRHRTAGRWHFVNKVRSNLFCKTRDKLLINSLTYGQYQGT